MKVLILGGTGVFGERLARLLARDGHQLTIAARTLPAAQALAAELGATALQIDRNGDLSALQGHEVIIDAAGPFHAYGPEPYRLARAALAAGAHYLDLADNAAFCAGITALDPQARTAGKAAISGLSSVPAVSSAAVRAFRLAADLLSPFGTGTGGMSVTVTTATHRRRWTLLATNGDGPFVPAIAIRALLRRPSLSAGATPALETVTLDEIEAAMSDLAIRCERQSEPLDPIFPRTLGPAFATLPDPIRATHLTAATSRWTGRASVTRGTGLWSRLLATLFRFPPASADTEVEVTKTATESGETWTRRFGARSFRSHLRPTPHGMTERFGPFTFTLGLTVRNGALHYPVAAGRLGPISLRRWMLPGSETREYAQDGVFHFDVRLLAPLTGALMVHYRGHLRPAEAEAPTAPPA